MRNCKECTCVGLHRLLTVRQSLDQQAEQAFLKHSQKQSIYRIYHLDRNQSFTRFMDLPPELRLHIYEELLVTRRDVKRPTLYPEVLKLSRQVHREALPILYDSNDFIIGFRWMQIKYRSQVRLLHAGLEMADKRTIHLTTHNFVESVESVESVDTETLSAMRRAKHISMDLEMTVRDDWDGRVAETVALAGVVLLLSGGPSCTQTLTVRVRESAKSLISSEDMARVLWPGTLLPTDVEFRIEGALLEVTERLAKTKANKHHGFKFDGEEAIRALRLMKVFRENCLTLHRGTRHTIPSEHSQGARVSLDFRQEGTGGDWEAPEVGDSSDGKGNAA